VRGEGNVLSSFSRMKSRRFNEHDEAGLDQR
jgi:hypothetical protein